MLLRVSGRENALRAEAAGANAEGRCTTKRVGEALVAPPWSNNARAAPHAATFSTMVHRVAVNSGVRVLRVSPWTSPWGTPPPHVAPSGWPSLGPSLRSLTPPLAHSTPVKHQAGSHQLSVPSVRVAPRIGVQR